MAAVRDGRVVYAKGFGVASAESKLPVSPDTLFRAGQSTKMFVAAALVTLAEQSRLKLDAPVGNYIAGIHPKIGAITVHQILAQTTGLKDEMPNNGPHDDAALAREVGSWDAGVFFTEPGRTFSTSNLGFALAGRLLEAVKGLPFADAMDEVLFRPLGMSHTTFRPTVAMTYPLAAGHSADGKVMRPAPDNAAYWAAFSLYSSAADLARFEARFLDPNPPLPLSMVATLSKPQVPRQGIPNTWYGYGLIVDNTRTLPIIRQAIAVPGYDGALAMSQESKSGVVVLMNAPGDGTGIADKLLERILPTGLGAPVPAAPPAGKNPSEYAGTYVNGGETVEIAAASGALTINKVAAEPTSGECFRAGTRTVCFADGYAHIAVRAYRKQK